MENLNSVTFDPNEFLVTTTPTIEGYRITKTFDIVTAECVFGMNIFKDLFASFSDMVGGRSNTTQKVLRDARVVCLNELRNEAGRLGGNAVVGVSLAYSEFSGQGKSMLFLVASGTAVIVKAGNAQSLFPSKPNVLQLSNPQCRLYLTEKYQIHRHDILGEFIANGQLFPTLDEALGAALKTEISEIELERLRKEEWAMQQRVKLTESTSKLVISDEDLQKMSDYGVEHSGESFIFGEYKYEKLIDAINYAKMHK
jgi:uncharacterized protein YbjQ (UPF0145 family)